MQYNDIIKVFSFISNEKIKASELKIGDIAFIHSRWLLVINTHLNKEYSNHGSNFIIQSLMDSTSYINPNDEVSIIKRDIINNVEMVNFINKHLEEAEELRKMQEKEEKRRIREEKRFLRNRLKELKY